MEGEKKEIKYTYAKFHRRCFGNLIDFFVFILALGLFFLGTRAIVTATPGFIEKQTALINIRKDSGLYYVEGTSSRDWVDHLDHEGSFSSYAKVSKMDDAINTFIAYLNTNVGVAESNKVKEDYDKFRLSFNYSKDGSNIPYFITAEDGTLSRNAEGLIQPGLVTLEQYYTRVYMPFYDEHALGYLVTLVPSYLDLVRFESIMLLGVELPISWLFAGILVYLVPGFFWKRGRQSFGKWTYRIGLANKDLLSPSLGQHFARWAIFFFGVLTLSIFTFAIPMIISTSLMAFSRKKQGLADYMLNLTEVDVSQAKLYYSFEEILLTGAAESKKPVDFKPIQED